MQKLEQAISVARKNHEGQKRKSGEPYITHPLAVVKILKDLNMPEEALVAAVLHDITEDTETTNLQISDMFGTRVGFILYALSKNQKPKEGRAMLESFNKEREFNKKINSFQNYLDYRFLIYVNRFYMSGVADPWIFFIKMADQIHNLSTLNPMNNTKKRRKIDEMVRFFFPIYKKAEDLLTPMYKKKYHKLLSILENELRNSRKKFFNETWLSITDGNNNLVGLETMPELKKDKYPCVILVHGFGVDKEDYGMFTELSERLANTGYIVYRFDFPGCGESSGDYSRTSISKLTDSLKTIVKYVKSKSKVDTDRIAIYAQSLGGAITLNANLELKTYILSGAFTNIRKIFKDYFKDGFNPTGISEKLRSNGTTTQIRKTFWEDLEQANMDLESKISNLEASCLIIRGEKDDLVPETETKQIFDLLTSNKKYIEIKEADHNLLPKRSEMIKETIKWLEQEL